MIKSEAMVQAPSRRWLGLVAKAPIPAEADEAAKFAQRRLEEVRQAVLLDNEQQARARALDAYDALDEASEQLIVAIVRLVEARAKWSDQFAAANQKANLHHLAADRARIAPIERPGGAPWPTEAGQPAVWRLLQPDTTYAETDPSVIRRELKDWVSTWHRDREETKPAAITAPERAIRAEATPTDESIEPATESAVPEAATLEDAALVTWEATGAPA